MSSVIGRSNQPIFEAILKRDRVIVLLAVAIIGLLTWACTLQMSANAGDPDHHHTRSEINFFLLFWMWAVMMVAMMLPAVTPTVLLVATLNRKNRLHSSPFPATVCFLMGYVVTWTLFSVLAALGQVLLHNRGLLNAEMGSATPLVGGGFLLVAGLFQWSAWKNACLKHCRSPLGFLMTQWRSGALGSFRMGLLHGLYCAGCCWALMLLMFVAGVMNVWWFLALTSFVLVEKLWPRGVIIGRVGGIVMFAWGLLLLAQYYWLST
jgi:predicted metal-binding membrane protein